MLLHGPGGVKAERLLIVGLGKAKTLSVDEVRKGAGAAVRAAKPRGIREMAIAFPEDRALSDEHLDNLPCDMTARALIEGAEIAEPDWDTYRSDRKDLAVRSLTVIAKQARPRPGWRFRRAWKRGLVYARAQNFARSLVNEPGNVLTPTELGRRAKAMCEEMGLACEVFGMDKLLELKMGAFAAVAQGVGRGAGADCDDVYAGGRSCGGIARDGARRQGDHVRYGRHFDQAGGWHGEDEVRHGGVGGHDRRDEGHRRVKPKVKVIGVVCSAENMPTARPTGPATW